MTEVAEPDSWNEPPPQDFEDRDRGSLVSIAYASRARIAELEAERGTLRGCAKAADSLRDHAVQPEDVTADDVALVAKAMRAGIDLADVLQALIRRIQQRKTESIS